MANIIAILEDDTERIAKMRACLAELLPNHEQMYFENAIEMVEWLDVHLPEVVLISLDHDLPIDPNCGTGRNVADYLAALPPTCPVIVHTSNEFFAPGMMFVLTEARWPTARVYPHSDHDWVRRGWTDQIRSFIANGLLFD